MFKNGICLSNGFLTANEIITGIIAKDSPLITDEGNISAGQCTVRIPQGLLLNLLGDLGSKQQAFILYKIRTAYF